MNSLSQLTLQKGDTIALCSTARFVEDEVVQAFMAFADRWELNTTVLSQTQTPFNQFAGNDEDRRKAFWDAYRNPDIKALFMARGGYGTVRTMEREDWIQFQAQPKWVIGFSDACYLLNPLSVFHPVIHGPMAIQLGVDPESDQLLGEFITGINLGWECKAKGKENVALEDARLIGGNLSIVYALLGTPMLPIPKNAVLFLEDLDEYIYHIDRMMASLYFAGILERMRAVLLGSFSDMKDHAIPVGFSALESIQHWCEKVGVPVVIDLPFGHKKENRPLILGADCKVLYNAESGNFGINWES